MADWIDTQNFAAYKAALRERHSAFLRGFFAFVRATPGVTPPDADAWADAQPPVWGMEPNAAVMARWIATLGLLPEAALELVGMEGCDDLLLLMDPAAGRPVLDCRDRMLLLAGGALADRMAWGANLPWGVRGETVAVRGEDGLIVEERTPVAIEGKAFVEVVTRAWDKSGPAWTSSTSTRLEEAAHG